MPDYLLETAAQARLGEGPVAGVDEVGRGPWAGPVVAAAVVLDMRRLPHAVAERLDDSKRVPAKRRLELFEVLPEWAEIGIGMADVDEIETLNILRASHLAMRRAVEALSLVPIVALVDGNMGPPLPCRAETVIGGDGLCLSIAAASIVAKVTRDRMMWALAADFPGFGWERNVGYGTPEHQAGLRRLGPTRHHRRTFTPVRNLLNPPDS